MEADVYVWHYALLVVHARKEEDTFHGTSDAHLGVICAAISRLLIAQLLQSQPSRFVHRAGSQLL